MNLWKVINMKNFNLKKPLDHARDIKFKSTIDTGEGLTEQAHKNETDMNYILRDYQRTGLLRHAKDNEGKYDDIAVQDFQDAMIIVANANSMFEELPANMRKQFSNNPANFLSFVQNPDNKSQLESMGIIKGNDGIDINGAPSNAPVGASPEAAPQLVPTSESASGNASEAE